MNIAFYAPMKSPNHPVPSGDRVIAQLYCQALREAGHDVTLVSELRSWNAEPNHASRLALKSQAQQEIDRIKATWAKAAPYDLWFTYHVYHKAPDLLGPIVTKEFDLPYVIAEPSHAPKQQNGPWALEHAIATQNIQNADLLLIQNLNDLECIRAITGPNQRIETLSPFVDTDLWRPSSSIDRTTLGQTLSLNTAVPWIVAVAMMRPGDKAASYQLLAQAMDQLGDIDWQLIVIGDGSARDDIQRSLDRLAHERVSLLGQCESDRINDILSLSDVFVWPAINEALGMSILEAQACGLPVVAGREGGVEQIVAHGRTGWLVDDRKAIDFARRIRHLLLNPQTRQTFGRAALTKTCEQHSVQSTGQKLDLLLNEVSAGIVSR